MQPPHTPQLSSDRAGGAAPSGHACAHAEGESGDAQVCQVCSHALAVLHTGSGKHPARPAPQPTHQARLSAVPPSPQAPDGAVN